MKNIGAIDFSWLLVLLISSLLIAMADAREPNSPAAVHIIYTEKPDGLEDPEAVHLRTLSTVLGSEEAAKKSLIYVYKTVANGFSAKLTPEEVEKISKLPGVVQVVPSQTYQLHGN